MNRFSLLFILSTTLFLSVSSHGESDKSHQTVETQTSSASDPDWQTVKQRSQLWVWGWTIADISSIVQNAHRADTAGGQGRRVRAKAEGIRAALGLWSVWKHQPTYFSLNSAPTDAQIQAQQAKANELYHWKSRIPNLVVNTALAAWVAEDGDKENALTVFGSGIFWGEVSLLTQRMLDTDWHWRVQDDQLHVSLAF